MNYVFLYIIMSNTEYGVNVYPNQNISKYTYITRTYR